MIWLDVKREVVAAVEGVAGLRGRAYPYSARKIIPPAFIVVFHEAYGDGMTRMPVPFSVVVGAIDQESAEAALSGYLRESGPTSVKAAVEDYFYTSCSNVVVERARPVVMTFGTIQYLGILFRAEASGKGA